MTERWQTDWRNKQKRHQEGKGAVPRRLLQKRKARLVADRRGISRSAAASLLAAGSVEVPDSEVEGWSPHDGGVRGVSSHV